MASLSISLAWDEAKARIAADGRLMSVVAAALIALPTFVSGVVSPNSSAAESTATGFVITLATLLLTIVGQLAIIRLSIGRSVSVGEAISHGARRMPIYVIAGLIVAIVLFLLLIPFIAILAAIGVPMDEQAFSGSPTALLVGILYLAVALFVGTRMLLSSPVASEEDAGPIAILRRSWNLTAGHFWRLLAFIVLFCIGAGIAVMAISLAAGFAAVLLFGPVEPMSASALVVALVEGIVSAAITVLLAVTLARIYVQVAGRDSLSATVPTSGT